MSERDENVLVFLLMFITMMIFIGGCAFSRQKEPRVEYYPNFGFHLVLADSWSVLRACDGSNRVSDRGKKIPTGTPVNECWLPGKRELWAVDSWDGCRWLPHGLKHADGSFTKADALHVGPMGE